MSEINRVKRAVSRGYRTRVAIAAASQLSMAKTQTYLTRLISRGLVESTSTGKGPEGLGAGFKHYHMVGIGFLLQDIWQCDAKSLRRGSTLLLIRPRPKR